MFRQTRVANKEGISLLIQGWYDHQPYYFSYGIMWGLLTIYEKWDAHPSIVTLALSVNSCSDQLDRLVLGLSRR